MHRPQYNDKPLPSKFRKKIDIEHIASFFITLIVLSPIILVLILYASHQQSPIDLEEKQKIAVWKEHLNNKEFNKIIKKKRKSNNRITYSEFRELRKIKNSIIKND